MQPHTPQYTDHGITRYEKIFGKDFVSTGGIESTKRLTANLELQPGMQVLDVGCGLGGSAFYLARVFQVKVFGIDLLPQMIAEAQRRAAAYELPDVHFAEQDILQAPLPPETHDLVYSRDAFLHIANKAALFTRLHDTLKPGGALFFTDYARGPYPGSEAFEAYRESNGYDLRELPAYADAVQDAGFAEVQVQDLTGYFIEMLRQEMHTVRNVPADGENPLTEEDRDYLLDRWQKKIGYCLEGDMRWCCIQAKKI